VSNQSTPDRSSIDVTSSFSRADLVKRGAALAVAGGAVGVFAETASADPISDQDLAYVRLLVTAELLQSNFYSQAIAASVLSGDVLRYVKRAYLNEQEHYQSVAGIVSGAGQVPTVSADVNFSYPDGTFDDQKSIVKAAAALESAVVSMYAGAMGGIVTNQFKTGIAQIAACEGQHSAYFQTTDGGHPFWLSFPTAFTIQQASDAMNAYTT
jgi:Ferritin-like domain